MKSKIYYINTNLVTIYRLLKSSKDPVIESLFYAIFTTKTNVAKENINKIIEYKNSLEIFVGNCKYAIYSNGNKSFIIETCKNLEDRLKFFEDEEDLSKYNTAETLYKL